MPITTDELEILRRELSELPATRPRTVSRQSAIAALAPELAAAQRRGYNIEELAQLLADRGLKMTPGTLRGYLRRNKGKRRRATKPEIGANGAKQQAGSAATTERKQEASEAQKVAQVAPGSSMTPSRAPAR